MKKSFFFTKKRRICYQIGRTEINPFKSCPIIKQKKLNPIDLCAFTSR